MNPLLVIIPACYLLVLSGCGSDRPAESLPRAPRPVSTLPLVISEPGRSNLFSGTVEPWKSEAIGFEVAGRVQYVVEPERDVFQELKKPDGSVFRPGTVLARLDPTRYELQVESIQAKIEAMRQTEEAARLEITQVIPAEKEGAEAEFTFTTEELKRVRELYERAVIPKTDYDRAVANYRAADAKVKQIVAKEKAKGADLASLGAQVKELAQALNDARRNVADCQLQAPFRGQVAEVRVIPGGYVERGQPVLTLQMMDPIKVQVQVSAETTRQLRYRDAVEIVFTQPDGSEIRREAMVYLIAPVADPATRTFPVTLLVGNEKLTTEVPPSIAGSNFARTRDVWSTYPVDDPVLGEGLLVLEVNSIHQDANGSFVWKVLNWQQIADKQTNVLEVVRIPVERGEAEIPLLGGLWKFAPVRFDPTADFDPAIDRVAGALLPADQADSWSGDRILFVRDRWLLRPGDVVGVDLNFDSYESGYYVPLDAILKEQEEAFIFTVSGSSEKSTVTRQMVRVGDGPGFLRRVTPQTPLEPGTRIIRRGAHYLKDGESVTILSQ